ncbi:MAG TPA: MmgE/PrpD family protein [Xanthobacteraceae bacterium]|nr:MmgE/PrpD family protein [Xanthobacteraceae bacterium]
MAAHVPEVSVAEQLVDRIVALAPERLPDGLCDKCEDLLVDVIGLIVTARNEDYVQATLAACDDDGPCTAIGHARTLSAAGAALVNGTAAHGEDFDDTFEGGPVHAGAVIVPAVLAACERHRPEGPAALLGIAVGVETMCRLGLVAPKRVHKAGFHPTAVFGAMAAAAGVGAALGLDRPQMVDALGIAGSMAAGIIEYLAEGAWTKRMHAGWAAQSGLRAALLARHGFRGPRTVFEGTHGLFHGFANTTDGRYDLLTDGFGARWVAETLAFKLYPCGTMTHPYIDCARRLAARGVKAADVKEMLCEVGEGTVHRLWEPLADKQRPPNGYAAKFSTPYCIAAGLVRGNVGLDSFTDAAVQEPALREAAAKVRYVIDPNNPYPDNFTGHIRAVLTDGRVIEERQPHMRGGAHEPLTRADIEEKFALCARHGGWDQARTAAALKLARGLFAGRIDLEPLRG